MSLKRVRNNLGFLIAGAILFGVAANIYYELNTTVDGNVECLCTSTP